MTAPAPAPPQGPGVYPPFPAPPAEGRGRRLGLGLGIGAAVLLLVCGGGVAAMIGLGVVASRAVNEQIEVVVSGYFDAVETQRFDDAYDMLCQQVRSRQREAEYTVETRADGPIRSYDVGQLGSTNLDLIVPVDVTYQDGRRTTLQVELNQNQQTGEFEVCGVGE